MWGQLGRILGRPRDKLWERLEENGDGPLAWEDGTADLHTILNTNGRGLRHRGFW
jgi:hypothetical protein